MVVLALMLRYGIVAGVTALWVPVILLVHVALTTAVALLRAMCNLFFRDVKYLTDVVARLTDQAALGLYRKIKGIELPRMY